MIIFFPYHHPITIPKIYANEYHLIAKNPKLRERNIYKSEKGFLCSQRQLTKKEGEAFDRFFHIFIDAKCKYNILICFFTPLLRKNYMLFR